MYKPLTRVLSAVLFCSCVSVFAEDVSDTGYYFGADVGQVDLNLKFKPGGLYAGENLSFDKNTVRIVNGIKFADWIALEIGASLSSSGDASHRVLSESSDEQDYFSLSVGPKFLWELNPKFKLIGKAGLQYTSYEQYDDDYPVSDGRVLRTRWEGDGLTVGLGAEYRMARRWFLRAGYDYFFATLKNTKNYTTSLKDLEAESHYYSLGITFQI